MPAWLIALNRHVPIRYLVLLGCALTMLLGGFAWVGFGQWKAAAMIGGLGVVIGLRDLRQTPRAVLRNYPVIGHLRYLLEFVRPEIRQYFIESDNEAAPFSRWCRLIEPSPVSWAKPPRLAPALSARIALADSAPKLIAEMFSTEAEYGCSQVFSPIIRRKSLSLTCAGFSEWLIHS